MSCGSPEGGADLAGVDLAGQAVVQGVVTSGSGGPVARAYVRLLDRGGEFVAEVPTDAQGRFRFFAGPGELVLRALAPGGAVRERTVTAAVGQITEVELS